MRARVWIRIRVRVGVRVMVKVKRELGLGSELNVESESQVSQRLGQYRRELRVESDLGLEGGGVILKIVSKMPCQRFNVYFDLLKNQSIMIRS